MRMTRRHRITDRKKDIIITSAGIFIEYMYAFSQGEAANVIIRPDNVEKCAEVLKANKLELIAASDLYKL